MVFISWCIEIYFGIMFDFIIFNLWLYFHSSEFIIEFKNNDLSGNLQLKNVFFLGLFFLCILKVRKWILPESLLMN